MTEVTRLSIVSRDVIDTLRVHQADPDKYRPIRTNIDELDKKIGGIREAMYVGIGGPAKTGKTAFSQHIAIQLSVANRGKVATFMLEEIAEQMAVRSLTRTSAKVNRSMIFNLELTEDNFESLELAQIEIEKMEFYVGDVYFTADEIIRTCKKEGIKFAIVDYQQLLMDKGSSSESERLNGISRKFVKSRNEDKITYIIVYQLNDDGKQLSSRSINRDADLIIEVSPMIDDRSEKPVPGKMIITVKPSRMCKEAGNIPVDFSGAHSRVTSPASFNTETWEFLGDQHFGLEDPQPYDDTDWQNNRS